MRRKTFDALVSAGGLVLAAVLLVAGGLLMRGYSMAEMGQGQTYSQLSAASLAQPKNTALAGLVQTVFRGTTLRSMLLEAYGFWMFGQIALFAAIASFTGAVLLLILSAIGLVHGRRVPAGTEVLAKTTHARTVTA
jgi:hypothetical protein